MSKFTEDVRNILYKNKEYVDERIESGIEQYRKGYCNLKFVDKNGNEVKNVKIKGELKKHAFNFGANLFMLDELETEEKNAKYKEYFKNLFNMATLPFYWCDLEPEEGKPRYAKDSPKIYRRPAPDLCIEWCKENGIRPKEHCLNYDPWSPDWLEKYDVSVTKAKLEKRFKELAERYAEDIYPWEVTNETFFANNKTKFYEQNDFVEWSFKTADKYFPHNELIINEAMWHSWEWYIGNRTPYYMQIERLINSGHRVDAVGIQYHMFWHRDVCLEKLRLAYDLKWFYGVLDKYAEFKKPLQITEITIPAYTLEAEDEELQAEIITRLYKVWFSHKNMESIIYWNLVDGYAAFAPQGSEGGENYYHGGLLRYDFTKKPAYNALYNLINKEWHTSIDTECSGIYTFKGFYGDYELETEADGKTVKVSFELTPDADNQVIIEI
ncbi:MAG: endo-1,4-beta-xylanase [Clostridia bacterium]|nr:endo-1,4-beta-xylanase [Clostridia bacterium]